MIGWAGSGVEAGKITPILIATQLPTRAPNGLFPGIPIDTQYRYDGTKFLSVAGGVNPSEQAVGA